MENRFYIILFKLTKTKDMLNSPKWYITLINIITKRKY